MLQVNYQAAIKNEQEQRFVDEVVAGLEMMVAEGQTPITHVKVARKMKSFGATVSSWVAVRKYRNSDRKEAWINLGRVSGGARHQIENIDFTLVDDALQYFKSERILAFLNK